MRAREHDAKAILGGLILVAFILAPASAKSATEGAVDSSPVCEANKPPQDNIAGCTKILSLPGNEATIRINALLVRGGSYAILGQPVLATDDLENAQKLHYSAGVAFALGGMYINVGRDGDAITELSKLIDAGTANAQVFNMRGAAYQNAGNFDASIEDFNKTLLLNPKDMVALNNRATAYEKKGNHDQAGKDIDAVLAVNPNLPIALANRCGLYAKSGKLDQGMPYCAKAESLEPQNPIVIMSIGAAYYDAAHYEDALKYFDRSVAMSPGNPRFLYMRGIVRLKLGHKDEAGADIAKATLIMPDVATAMSKLGFK